MNLSFGCENAVALGRKIILDTSYHKGIDSQPPWIRTWMLVWRVPLLPISNSMVNSCIEFFPNAN